MLGRSLSRFEIVHHRDGNKFNNDPTNLEVIIQSNHIRLHHSMMMEQRKKVAGY
jgi:hypothetical protein